MNNEQQKKPQPLGALFLEEENRLLEAARKSIKEESRAMQLVRSLILKVKGSK